MKLLLRATVLLNQLFELGLCLIERLLQFTILLLQACQFVIVGGELGELKLNRQFFRIYRVKGSSRLFKLFLEVKHPIFAKSFTGYLRLLVLEHLSHLKEFVLVTLLQVSDVGLELSYHCSMLNLLNIVQQCVLFLFECIQLSEGSIQLFS